MSVVSRTSSVFDHKPNLPMATSTVPASGLIFLTVPSRKASAWALVEPENDSCAGTPAGPLIAPTTTTIALKIRKLRCIGPPFPPRRLAVLEYAEQGLCHCERPAPRARWARYIHWSQRQRSLYHCLDEA